MGGMGGYCKKYYDLALARLPVHHFRLVDRWVLMVWYLINTELRRRIEAAADREKCILRLLPDCVGLPTPHSPLLW